MTVNDRGRSSIGLADAVGVTVALTAVAVWPALPDPVNHPKMLVLTIGALAVLPFAVRWHLRNWRANPGFTARRAVLVAAIVLPLWASLSAVVSDATWQDSLFGAWGRGVGLLTLFAVASLLLAAATFNRADIDRFISWIMALAVAEVVVGSMQLLGTRPVPGNQPEGVVMGTFGNSNFAAGYLAIIACLLAARVLSRGTSVFQRWLSAGLVVALGGLMLGTGATQAIGAGFAGAAAFFITLAVAYRGPRRRWGLAGAALIGVAGATGIVASVFGVGPLARLWADTGFAIRIEYWKATLATFQASPVFGTGPDGLKRVIGQYRPESYVALLGQENKLDAAHNVVLHIAATIGVIGAVAWAIVMVGSLALLGYRAVRGPVASPVLLAAVFAAFVAYLVQGMVSIDMLPLISIGWTVAGIALALSATSVSSEVPANDDPPSTRQRSQQRSTATRHTGDKPHKRDTRVTILAVAVAVSLVIASATLLAQHMRSAARTQGTLDPQAALAAVVDPMTPCSARNALAQALVASLPAEEILDPIIQATAIDPRCGFMIHFQSELANNSGDYRLADRSTRQGIEFDPLLVVSWVLRGLVLLNQGDLAGAGEALVEAERIAAITPQSEANEGQLAVLRDQLRVRISDIQ